MDAKKRKLDVENAFAESIPIACVICTIACAINHIDMFVINVTWCG